VLCDSLEVRIGMTVSVTFENRDGIFLPQFKPSET
jgi:hypothetical protein